jgi:hypothetical protein
MRCREFDRSLVLCTIEGLSRHWVIRWSWAIEYCRELDDRLNDRPVAFHEDLRILREGRSSNVI